MLNRINEAVRAAEAALKIAKANGDKRGEGQALAALNKARTRQMQRDRRKKQGQYAPEAIAAAKLIGKVAALAYFIALAAVCYSIVNPIA